MSELVTEKGVGSVLRRAGKKVAPYALAGGAMLGGAAIGGAAGTAANMGAGAAGAGPGKRWEGAKEGARATGRSLMHPLDATDPAEAHKYNPYVAGKKLRESD